MKGFGFDPGQDIPPHGAVVKTRSGPAIFRDGNMPGWWLADGRYARPFDSLGNLLARQWALLQVRACDGCTAGQCDACDATLVVSGFVRMCGCFGTDPQGHLEAQARLLGMPS